MDQLNPDEDSSLKMPPDEKGIQIDYSALNQPEPMGSPPTGPRPQTGQASRPTPAVSAPTSMPAPPAPSAPTASGGDFTPSQPIVPFLLMFFLAIILVAAVLVFFSWKGWISLGGLEKLWGGGKTSPSPTGQVSPTLSPLSSPSIETSPKITTNINDQTRKSDLSSIKTSLELYFADNNKFPESQTIIKTSDSSSVLAQALVPKYLNKLPDDPLTPEFYYGYKSDGLSFELTCVLEDKTDPEGTLTGQYYIYKLKGSMGT